MRGQRPGSLRWRVALVLGLSLLIAYYDRLNLSLALPLIAAERGWDDAQLRHYGALLMGLFYGGCGVANILLSPAAARLGPRRSLQMIVVLWSLFTALGAWASQFLTLFLATRVLLGISEGMHFPVMNALTKAWFPPSERSRANSLWISGIFLALLTAPLVLVPWMHAFGWRSGFYLMAAAGLLLLPLVRRVIHDTPHRHPRATPAEIAHIEGAVAAEDAVFDGSLRAQLLRPGVLLLVAAGCINNMIALGIAGWLPSYFTTRLGVPFEEVNWPVALTQSFAIGGVALWAVLGDRSNRRALIAATGFGGMALFIFLAMQATALWNAVLLFGLGTFFVAAWSAQEFALLQHQVPASSITQASGIYNGVTILIGGSLGPLVTSSVMDRDASVLPLVGLCLAATALLGILAARLRY